MHFYRLSSCAELQCPVPAVVGVIFFGDGPYLTGVFSWPLQGVLLIDCLVRCRLLNLPGRLLRANY